MAFAELAERLRAVAVDLENEGEDARREIAGRCREVAARIRDMARRLDRLEKFKDDPPDKWFD